MNRHAFEPRAKPGRQAEVFRSGAQDREGLAEKNGVGPLLHVQRIIGNQASQRLLQSRPDSLASPSGGAPLGADVRARYEAGLGTSLADVRIYTDARAAASAEMQHANAYTIGHDIVFGAGRYDPGSLGGERLLAHEAAHVAQQHSRTPVGSLLTVSRPGGSAERAADHAAHELLAGRPARLVPGSEPFGIYRQPNAPDAAGTDARALVRAWLEKHEFAPPVEQPEPDETKDPKPDEGEPPKPDERKQP